MNFSPIIIMRATQKKMMSKPVTSTLVGVEALASSAVGSGQPSVENGHSAEENQVSSTSSSWRSVVTAAELVARAHIGLVAADVDIALRRRTRPGCGVPTTADG